MSAMIRRREQREKELLTVLEPLIHQRVQAYKKWRHIRSGRGWAQDPPLFGERAGGLQLRVLFTMSNC